MADIKQIQQNLDTLVASTKTFSNIFNSASNDVTHDIYEMDASFDDIKEKINELNSQSNMLKKALQVSVDRGNTNAIKDIEETYKELNNQLGSISPSIKQHIDALNTALETDFDISATDSLKEKITSLANSFAYLSERGQNSLKEIRPDLDEICIVTGKQIGRAHV